VIGAAAFLLLREVERRGNVQSMTNMGGAVQIKSYMKTTGWGESKPENGLIAAEKHCSPYS